MPGQGYNGANGYFINKDADIWCTGGGGGAGEVGGRGKTTCALDDYDLTQGGDGLQSNISGSSLWYAG